MHRPETLLLSVFLLTSAALSAIPQAGAEGHWRPILTGSPTTKRSSDNDALLLKAAAGGNDTTVKKLLSQGADPNARDDEGNTPLIRCAWWTQYDVYMMGEEEQRARVIELLLARGADPNVRGKDGLTALMRAAGWDHAPTFNALLKGGADPLVKDNRGRTALTWAARNTYRRKEFIEPLLASGAKMGVTEALLTGDSKRARELIGEGADLSVCGGYDDAPLMIAAEWGDLETAKALLQRRVDVNAHDSKGLTALMIAAAGRPGFREVGRYWTDHGVKTGRGAIILALAKAGAGLEMRWNGSRHDTPLSLAIEGSNEEAALALISAGANPNNPVETWQSYIHLAAYKREDAVVLALLRAGAKVRSSSPVACVLGAVVPYCRPATVRAVIRAGAPINAADPGGTTPLMGAVAEGKIENARILLDAGAKIELRDDEGNTALGIALDLAPASGIPQLLLKRGARIGLIEALLMGNRAKALALIRSGAKIDIASRRGFSPLMIACEWGDVGLIRTLLVRGAKVSSPRNSSSSPLLLAACGRDDLVFDNAPGNRCHTTWVDHGRRGKSRIPVVVELLAHGVKIDEPDEFGHTVLERSSAKGDLDVMEFALIQGADPNYGAPTRQLDAGPLPLVSAAGEGHLAAVELLIGRGARVDGGPVELDETPLGAAVYNEHVAVVRFLLSRGANPKLRNWNGSTPLQLARESKNRAILELLNGARTPDR